MISNQVSSSLRLGGGEHGSQRSGFRRVWLLENGLWLMVYRNKELANNKEAK